MFPAVDVSVINRVLRRQKGHMEHSVSNLLAITAGETDTASSQPVYTLRQPVRRAAPQRQQRQQQHQNPLRRGELLQDPVASVEALVQGLLQPGNTALRFLAPPSRFKQRVRPLSGNTVESQEEQDRLFAEMLQNQQFMRQLREEPHLFDGPEQKSTAPQSEHTEDGEQEEEEGEESLSS
jgi:hypothetical protein